MKKPVVLEIESSHDDTSFPIMAIGDSLTRGFYNNGMNYHPYSVELQRLLNEPIGTNQDHSSIIIIENNIPKDVPLRTSYNVYQFGVNGEQTPEMKDRLPRFLKKQLSQKDVQYHRPDETFDNMYPNEVPLIPLQDYRGVIIIGGTNDFVFSQSSSEQVFKNLLDMYQICLNEKSVEFVVACSTPSCYADNIEQFRDVFYKKKLKLNESILKFVEEYNQKQIPGKKMVFVDLMNEINWFKCTPEERKEYWASDNLHFSPKGSDKLAQILFNALKKALM
ncbi:hypothetical protein C9374_012455 [Naegleria lovaniensis]|uniref:SGNH hydrolase-type esterase domain-containing protein n=1 Tax=Naegleria lovaniensis TaxID=51637 RepID=A0AA88GZT3_NAELO|nr:uncharacterized protein C9374_012455 [Naegleria lovaniensis]KAG2392203.1 hypothetical protein C9374_012455 [Naegleria lovaniensis]